MDDRTSPAAKIEVEDPTAWATELASAPEFGPRAIVLQATARPPASPQAFRIVLQPHEALRLGQDLSYRGLRAVEEDPTRQPDDIRLFLFEVQEVLEMALNLVRRAAALVEKSQRGTGQDG